MNLKSTIIIIFLFLNFLHADTSTLLTSQEKQFLKYHPTIKLGTNDSWPPFSILNNDGTVTGYDIDILNKINEATGANFVLQLGDWSKIQEMAQQKKIDGISNIAIYEERKAWFNFSTPYISMKKRVMVKRGNPLNIKSISDIDGKTIAVHKGNMPDTKIAKQFTNSNIIYAETVEKMIEEVIFGKADLLFGNGSTEYLLGKLGLPYLDSVFSLDNNLDLAFAIRKDWPEAISILNKGLKSISAVEQNKLTQKWFSSIKDKKQIKFDINEFVYLKKKKEITMCIDPNWMPFEKYENDKHIGMTSDYFKIFEQSIGIPIKPIKTESWTQSIEYAKQRRCDILSLVRETPKRKKYLNFTKSYINESVVLATKPNISFIDNLNQLKNQKIGIVKGYAFKEILLQQYPNLIIVDTNSVKDGLEKVCDGKLFGIIDTLPTIAYMLQNEFLGQLKISAKVDNTSQLCIGVRNDDLTLLRIFNKVINKLEPKIHQEILNKYIGIHYQKGFDYSLFWKIFAVFSITLLAFYIKYYISNKYNEKMKQYINLIDHNFLSSSSDLNGNITQVSEALCRTTGYKKEELIGKNHNIFRHKDMPDSTFKNLWETILSGKEWRGKIKNLNKDGSYYWADSKITPIFSKNGTIKGFNALRFDITDKVALKELSNTDKLTQIPNRLYLDTQYTHQITRAQRYDTVFSIIIIDIDFFKNVNDNYGHKVGDNTLIQLAQILKHNIRSLDVLGRWGGEEFLIICTETDINKAKILAEKIKIKIEKYNFPTIGHLTCSFSVTQYLKNDKNESTFKRADTALYKAKNSGKNKVCAI